MKSIQENCYYQYNETSETGGKCPGYDSGRYDICRTCKSTAFYREYTNILNCYPEFNNRHKCSCCGNDIFYSNTKIKKDINYNLKIDGNNYQSKVTLYGIEYPLQVCEKCVKEKFPIENNKKVIIRPDTERGRFAFNIPYEISKKWSKEFNSNSLEKCIKKYGDVEGQKRWEKYCKSISITLNKFVEKYGRNS